MNNKNQLFAEIQLLRQEISIIRTHLELQESLLDSILSRIEDMDEEWLKDFLAAQEVASDKTEGDE